MEDDNYILSEIDRLFLEEIERSVKVFVTRIIYRHGVSIGFALGSSSLETINTNDGFPIFDRLGFSWLRWYGSLNLTIHDTNNHARFYSGDRTLDYNASIRFLTYDRQDEWSVTRLDSSINNVVLFAATTYIESYLADTMSGIVPFNHFGLCQSGLSHQWSRYDVLQSKIGNLWLCDECVNRFSLAEPVEIGPDATPKEKGERDKMTPSIRFDVLLRDSFTCKSCGRSPNRGDDIKLHVDHVKPIAHGGKTVMENLQTLCEECNLGKSDKWNRQIELQFSF